MAWKLMSPPIPTIGDPVRATWSILWISRCVFPLRSCVYHPSSFFSLYKSPDSNVRSPLREQAPSTSLTSRSFAVSLRMPPLKRRLTYLGSLNSSKPASCDACLCSLIDAVVPALRSSGFELESAGGFAGAQSILQACMITLASPLTAAG